ncbi:hypothetical protein AR158_c623R [Paramecium bursaria Chlorella virus AR158]|uniref:hypothetical protein n=1 Tax=Paramecium bursaria Chlorella virus AR158 TaxID=380598 RepID=UPI00015AA7D8|nr:hypothetical protein AR158_c623R [Paramecium bursaria Chlorella virus AR158]ABU44168.1 hypothetical protein AR158_c623R [Paramecium bursaria Chlorella virus AR158]
MADYRRAARCCEDEVFGRRRYSSNARIRHALIIVSIRYKLFRFSDSQGYLVSTKQPRSIARREDEEHCRYDHSLRSWDSHESTRCDASEMRGVVRCSRDASEPRHIRTRSVCVHSRRLPSTERHPE